MSFPYQFCQKKYQRRLFGTTRNPMAVILFSSIEDLKPMTDENIISRPNAKKLPSMLNFDRVDEMKKPEIRDSGFFNKNLDSAESDTTKVNNSNVSYLPNSYNKNGACMEFSGFFIIPRSVTSDPRYKGARLKYKHVLHVLFEKVAFTPTTHAVGVHVIKINIGQFCVSEEYLAEICNEGVKYEEDMVNRALVHRAIQFWKKCGFVNQEVNHKKNVLTITIPEFYDRLKNRTEPIIEPRPNHDRTTKEEYKEYKEDIISSKKEETFVPSAFATSLLSEFYSSLFSSIPDFPKHSARKTKTQYQAADRILKKANGDMNLIKKVISYAHQPGGFWLSHVHSVSYLDNKFTKLVQQLRDQGKKPMNGHKPQPKYNYDTSPSHPSKSISFAEQI